MIWWLRFSAALLPPFGKDWNFLAGGVTFGISEVVERTGSGAEEVKGKGSDWGKDVAFAEERGGTSMAAAMHLMVAAPEIKRICISWIGNDSLIPKKKIAKRKTK